MRPSFRRAVVIGMSASLAASFTPPAPTSAADPLSGKLVWIHHDQAQGDSDIWVMNADGSGQRALTTNAINEFDPVWSPDGSRIAFTSERDGNQRDVFVMDEDGTDVQRLTQGMGEFQIGDWSPTASELVGTLDTYDADTDSTARFLVLVDTDSGDVTELRSYEDGYSTGSFSPDGSEVLASLFRAEDPDVGGSDLWSIDHSGAATRITDTPYPIDEARATWAPDGSRIAFFASVDEADSEVLVMDADGSNVVQLTDDDGFDESPAWSADSASIAFDTSRADEVGDKWVMNADGSEPRPLVTLFGGEGSADWAAGSVAPVPPAESVSGTIAAGGSLTTADGDAPDVANPTDTTVTSPFAGDVTISESDQPGQLPPADYVFIGQGVSITAVTDPATDAGSPLHISFTLDRSLIPGRVSDAAEILSFRDGSLVEPCAAGEGEPAATPDPCVLSTFYSEDLDVTIDVLSSAASDWNFGLAPVAEPPPPTPPESVSAVIEPGGTLTTDTELDGVTSDDVLETTVTTSPDGDAGTVTITEVTEGVGVAGPDFTFLDVFPSIEAPDGTAGSPLLIEFLIHSSRVPSIPLEELRVLRHGVPVEPCTGDGPAAAPEPCEATKELVGSDVRIVVRTAQATGLSWTFGYNLPPQPVLVVESTALDALDHLVLMLSDEIDPTSIPAPSDFDVRVDGIAVTETDVRLLFQGLREFPPLSDAGFSDGIAFVKISWETPVDASLPITLAYTPGAHPLRDASGNETPAFEDAALERFSPDLELAFIDDGAGPNHLIFLTAPLDPALPDPADFSVSMDDGSLLTGTDADLRHTELGFGLLDVTLDGAAAFSMPATFTYAAGAVPLRRLDGSTVPGFTVDVFVNVSGSDPGFTPPSDEPLTITLNDYLGNGATTLEVTFPTVGEDGGVTTFSSIGPAEAPPLGADFAAGDPPAFYEISTTATFTPPAEVCLTYHEGSYDDEAAVRLVHYDDPDWIDVTSSLDTDANRVCGTVDSFSPFAVVESAARFDFRGFFRPVDNLEVLNAVSAGRAIPVKFSLGGNQGMDIFVAGAPASVRVACPLAAPVDTIETTTAATANSLSYDSASDQYTFVWKTDKGWNGTCRELHVTFTDGTTHSARFKFGK